MGKELESARNKRGLSQHDVADQVDTDLSFSAYNLYERGVRGIPLDKLFKVAELLETTVTRLLLDAETDFASVMPETKAVRRTTKAGRRPGSPGKDSASRKDSSKDQ